MFATNNFRSTLNWFSERRTTRTNGLLYGDSYSGKTYAAKCFAQNNSQVGYVHLGLPRSYKNVIMELYYGLRRHYNQGNNCLKSCSYGSYNTTKQQIEEVVSNFLREEEVDLIFLDELSRLKEKYFVYLAEFLANLNITLVAIEYTPKIQWHLDHGTDLVATLDYRYQMDLLDWQQTSDIVDTWQQQNQDFKIDRSEYQNIFHYSEGCIGTLVQILNGAKASYHQSMAYDLEFTLSPPDSFQDYLLKKLRKAYDAHHTSHYLSHVSGSAIEEYGTRDRALVMTILETSERSAINAIDYKYTAANAIKESDSVQTIIDYATIRQEEIENFGEHLRTIAILAGWFIPKTYNRQGLKKINIPKARSIIYSLVKENHIQVLKQYQPYRYITTDTFQNYLPRLSSRQ